MAKVLSGDSEDGDSCAGAPLRSWMSTQKKKQVIRKKVIKAEDAQFDAADHPGEDFEGCDGEPRVKPIKNADIVEGVEIVCRCGEKLIIRFNLEDHERNN